MTPRAFILKVIRMRDRLERMGKSRKDAAEVLKARTALKTWLDFYPHATDEQVQRFALRQKAEILTLLPGTTCPSHASFLNQLNSICFGEQTTING